MFEELFNMPPRNLSQSPACLQCNNELTPEREIKCDARKRYIHSTCSSLTRAEIQCLKSPDRKLSFICERCEYYNGSAMNKLQELVLGLQAEIKSLKDANNFNVVDNQQINPEVVIHEIQDRQLRARNIIILNVKESDDSRVKNRIESDIRETKELLNDIELPDNSFKCIRVGKFSPQKTRPIKVIFNNNATALHVLKNKKNIRNRDVRVFADQTKMQRQYFLKIRN